MWRNGANRCVLTFHLIGSTARVLHFSSSFRNLPAKCIDTKHSERFLSNFYQFYKPITFAMAKRKGLSTATQGSPLTTVPIPPPVFDDDPAPPPKRRAGQRKPDTGSTNPNKNPNVLDGPEALRASPDADEPDERMNLEEAGMSVEKQVKEENNDSPLSDISDIEPPVETKKTKAKAKAAAAAKTQVKEDLKKKPATTAKAKSEAVKELQFLDPEAEGDEEADEEEIQAALSRPPPVHSDYLPLPWKGRLGYVRVGIIYVRIASNKTGVPLHISTLLQSARFQLKNLSYC